MPRPMTGTARAYAQGVLLHDGDFAADRGSLLLDPVRDALHHISCRSAASFAIACLFASCSALRVATCCSSRSTRSVSGAAMQAAADAQVLGESLVAAHWKSAAESPGLGLQVQRPAVPGPVGPPRGEGFNLPVTAPALRPGQVAAATPSWAAPEVGGTGFHHTGPAGGIGGLDGVQWPALRRWVARSRPSARGQLVLRVRRCSRCAPGFGLHSVLCWVILL